MSREDVYARRIDWQRGSRVFELRAFACACAICGLLLVAPAAKAQPGPPPGRGPRQDAAFAADRATFRFLLSRHDVIRREVKRLDDGVETTTESDDAEVAAKIQEHVPAMARRIKHAAPIHLRDPLFRELFRHADKIVIEHRDTEKGVWVKETSSDAYVARLIQAHAEAVSQFVKNGFEEAHRDHAVPKREP